MHLHLSCPMGKPSICIGEKKGADQLCSKCLCFHYTDSTLPLLSNPKFPVSSHLLCLYSSVCVGHVRKPHCCFFHEVAHLFMLITWHRACADNENNEKLKPALAQNEHKKESFYPLRKYSAPLFLLFAQNLNAL